MTRQGSSDVPSLLKNLRLWAQPLWQQELIDDFVRARRSRAFGGPRHSRGSLLKHRSITPINRGRRGG